MPTLPPQFEVVTDDGIQLVVREGLDGDYLISGLKGAHDLYVSGRSVSEKNGRPCVRVAFFHPETRVLDGGEFAEVEQKIGGWAFLNQDDGFDFTLPPTPPMVSSKGLMIGIAVALLITSPIWVTLIWGLIWLSKEGPR